MRVDSVPRSLPCSDAQDSQAQDANTTKSNNARIYTPPAQPSNLPIHFHLLADSISPHTLAKLRALESTLNAIYPTNLYIHNLSQAEFSALNPWGEAGVNWCAYFRLKLGSVLPQNLTRCIYLDTDTLVLQDIRELFYYDIGECAIGAVRSGLSGEAIKIVREHLIRSQDYFNSGVLLIDLPKWRAKDLSLIHTPKYADQDFLNLIFTDSVAFLPDRFNLQWLAESRIHFDDTPAHIDANGIASHPSNISFEHFASALISPAIVHFLGGYKPWEKCNFQANPHKHPIFINNPYHKVWWAIARCTPFARVLTLAYYKRASLIVITAYLRAYTPLLYTLARPLWQILKTLKHTIQRSHNV